MKKLFYWSYCYILVLLLSNCYYGRYYRDLSKDKIYSKWINRRFTLLKDCYVIIPKNPLNYKIKEKYYEFIPKQYIGRDIKGATIVTKISKGSLFKVVYIYQMSSFNSDYKKVYVRK